MILKQERKTSGTATLKYTPKFYPAGRMSQQFRLCQLAGGMTLPRFHAHQNSGNFLMDGGRYKQERVGWKPAVY